MDSTNYVSTINYLSSFLLSSYNNLLRITNASLNFYNLKYNSANLLSIFILKNDLDSFSHQSIIYFDKSINGPIRFLPGNLKHISYNVLIIFAVLLLGKSMYPGNIYLVKLNSSSNSPNWTWIEASLYAACSFAFISSSFNSSFSSTFNLSLFIFKFRILFYI